MNSKNMLIKNTKDITKVCCDFEKIKSWEEGQGLNFFKYLIVKKMVNVDMNVKLNFRNMQIFFSEDGTMSRKSTS